MRKPIIVVSKRGMVRGSLRYNEVKTAILQVLTTEGWCDSNRIIERTRAELGVSTSSRAVRMALLRYHRYGLLHREWRHGEYAYRLSDRGAKRLVWLRGLATNLPTVPDRSSGTSLLNRSDASE